MACPIKALASYPMAWLRNLRGADSLGGALGLLVPLVAVVVGSAWTGRPWALAGWAMGSFTLLPLMQGAGGRTRWGQRHPWTTLAAIVLPCALLMGLSLWHRGAALSAGYFGAVLGFQALCLASNAMDDEEWEREMEGRGDPGRNWRD